VRPLELLMTLGEGAELAPEALLSHNGVYPICGNFIPRVQQTPLSSRVKEFRTKIRHSLSIDGARAETDSERADEGAAPRPTSNGVWPFAALRRRPPASASAAAPCSKARPHSAHRNVSLKPLVISPAKTWEFQNMLQNRPSCRNCARTGHRDRAISRIFF
jgi:hypothetical protein